MKVALDVAIEEVNKWLDYKRVNDKKRESYKENIETLVDAVADGYLRLNQEDHKFILELKFPTDGESPVKSLEFKPRIKVSQVHQHLQGVKSTDADGRLLAYVAALTSQPSGIIKGLDTEDYNVALAIAIFFL